MIHYFVLNVERDEIASPMPVNVQEGRWAPSSSLAQTKSERFRYKVGDMINKNSIFHGNKRTLGFILLLLASTRCGDARERDAPPVYEVAHPATADIQKRIGSGKYRISCSNNHLYLV